MLRKKEKGMQTRQLGELSSPDSLGSWEGKEVKQYVPHTKAQQKPQRSFAIHTHTQIQRKQNTSAK